MSPRGAWAMVLGALALACATPARDVPRAATHVDALLRLGDSVYRSAPDSARRLWDAALVAARATHDSAGVARALTGLGQAARQLGDFEASRRLGEDALALKQRLGLERELFRSYNALGLLALDEERLGAASVLFANAADAARASGDSAALLKAMANVGLVATALGAFDRARDAYEAVRDAARARGDSVTLGRTLNNLAALDVTMGDPLAAVAGLETARRIARAIGDSVLEVNARGQLATAYDALGEPQRAFALLDSALAMARRGGRRAEEAEDLKLIADLFADAGDQQHALDHYRRALAATDSLGQPEERGNILRNEARAHASLGNVALALQRAAEARRVHRAAGLAYPELADLIVLAGVAQRARRHDEALAYLRDAHAIARRSNAPVAAVRVAIADASVAADAGAWDRVLRVLEDTRGTLALAGSSAEAEALALQARAYAELGQRDAALVAGRRAVAAVERVRRSYASGELRTAYASDRSDVYAAQVLLLLRAGQTAEAFEIADAARGRALIEHLAAARADVRSEASGGVRASGGALLAQEELLRRIDMLVARLQQREARASPERSPSLAETTSELRDSLFAARAEYEALVARGGPDPAPSLTTQVAVRASPRPAARDIQRSLRPDEALLEYLVTADRLLVFVLTRTDLTTFVVDERAGNLAARVHLARELVQRRDRDEAARGVLRALHRVLVTPVAGAPALRGVRRLVIVPHGALTYLPFAALVDPATGRYLAESYTLLRLPTSASLPALRAAVPSATSTPARVAGRGAEVFAPFPDSLPATRDEAASIGRMLPGAIVHLGASATELRVRGALARDDVVHLATHARMNARNPLFSDLVLTGPRTGSTRDDGVLEVHELLGLRSSASLVFLSGCETALGGAWATRFDTGEDYATIAQALLYAGARNVVATLWRIDDAGGSAFAQRFYAALDSVPIPEALVRAQRAMIVDPRFGRPYYWAAYTVSGAGGGLAASANAPRLSDRR